MGPPPCISILLLVDLQLPPLGISHDQSILSILTQ